MGLEAMEALPFRKTEIQVTHGCRLCARKILQEFNSPSRDFLRLFFNFVRNGMEKIRGLSRKQLTVQPSIRSLQVTLLFAHLCAISILQSNLLAKTPTGLFFSITTEGSKFCLCFNFKIQDGIFIDDSLYSVIPRVQELFRQLNFCNNVSNLIVKRSLYLPCTLILRLTDLASGHSKPLLNCRSCPVHPSQVSSLYRLLLDIEYFN